MTGLTCAYRLAKAGRSVDVYERWPGLGGQVATIDLEDSQPLERYYHHLFTSDRHIAALYDELGMPDAIEWSPSSVAVFSRGRLYPFVSPLDILRFSPLSLRGRLRLATGVFRVVRGGSDFSGYEGITARAWIEREMGDEVWNEIWGPLLRGKFGDRADDVSMAWLWARITSRRRIGRGETRRELLGYPRGSWQPLLDTLQAKIEEHGGRVLIDQPAASLRRSERGLELTWGEADSWRAGLNPQAFPAHAAPKAYETVVATVPHDIFLALLDDALRSALSPGYAQRLESVEYHTALCLLLEVDRSFSPFYWINVAANDFPFVGLVEQTNLVGPEHYGGRHLVYVANYVAPGDPLLELDADVLLATYEPWLRRINPEFSADWVRRALVAREPAAQPIVTPDYPDRIPPLQTGVPGLILATTTQIYPEDRGTNYSVRLGDRAADAVLSGEETRP